VKSCSKQKKDKSMPNPFHKPTTPKNSLQLLQWLIFEPVLFERYEKTLSETQTAIIVLKSIIVNFFIVIIPLTLVLYAIVRFLYICTRVQRNPIFWTNQISNIGGNI
jgi:hypothetical protein